MKIRIQFFLSDDIELFNCVRFEPRMVDTF